MSLGSATANDYADALSEDRPLQALRDAVAAQLAQGIDRANVMRDLQHFRAELQQAGREQDEDYVLDVMDFLTGFCSPRQRL